MGSRAAVSAPHLLAARAAIDVLEAGGNAVDAAVAAAAASTVVQPFSSSVAGVGWANVYERATGKTEVLQFHGAAPMGLDVGGFTAAPSGMLDWQALEARGAALLGSLVPAAASGWEALLVRKGTWPLSRVLESAIALARGGFPVSELLHQVIKQNVAKLARWPASGEIFVPGGRVLRPGERLVQTDLGATLERIADNGAAELTEGRTARALLDLHRRHGGALSGADLAVYTPSWHPPLVTTYRGHIVHAAPPPLGDVSFVSGLQLLEAFPAFDGPSDPNYIAASVQSARLVNAERRRYLGPRTDKAVIERLLGPQHVSELRAQISSRASGTFPSASADGHTITLAVVDKDGNAANIMQTVGTFFGTGAVAPGTGALVNSCLYFAYVGGDGANRVVPGHGIEQNPCLATVFDHRGELELVLGSPGGRTRVETVRQMLVNFVDFGMNVQEAVDARRFLGAPDGSGVDFEQRYGPVDRELRATLESDGYRVRLVDEAFCSGQAIAVDLASRTRMAAADWRRESVALAY
jgi:gamma-glutamyltranspeptidase / glutathione hydrolase